MLLALDISTSVVGLALFGMEGENYKLHDLSYKKFNPKKNLFERFDEFVEYFKDFEIGIEIKEISIEEPLKKFKGKFSNADTIQKLTQMNAMISTFLYLKTGIKPNYYNVNNARSTVFPELKIPKSHPNKKYLIWEAVDKAEPKVIWKYSKTTHKLIDENFDMADAWVVGMAHICSKINSKTSVDS
jgi:hypothetical protein